MFNVLSETKETYHPLGESLVKKFSNLPPEIEELKKQYLKGEIARHPYQYCTLGVNTDEKLKAKSLSPNYDYGKKTLKAYSEKMYPLCLVIEEKLGFFKIFSEEILPEYEELCQENQKHLNKNVYDALKSFWDLEENIELFLMPNILATGGSFGLFRKNTMYSITSPALTKKNSREFTQQNLIFNSVHEFSHSIFKTKLLDLGKFAVFTEKAQRVKIPEKLLEKHKKPEIYTEEAFVKALTHFILVNLYRPFLSLKESEEKEREILNKIVNDGYIHAEVFYEELKKGKDPIGGYEKVLGENSYA